MSEFQTKTPRKPTAAQPKRARGVAGAKAKREYDDAIALPSSPNIPPPHLTDYTWMLYGEKGIGKSTLAAQFPDVSAYFMWEKYRRGLKIRMIPDPSRNEKPLTWPRFQEYLTMLLENQEPGRIVVDTLDLCSKAWESHHATTRGVTSLLGIKDHGKTWDACMDDWLNTFASLLYAGWRFTFVSHVRKRPRVIRGVSREDLAVLAEEGVVASETQPSARPWAVGWTKEPVAYAGYYGWWGIERVLHIRGSGDVYAACENSEDHFLQPKGKEFAGMPYHMLPMGNTPAEAYRNLCLGWDNKLEGYFASADNQQDDSAES